MSVRGAIRATTVIVSTTVRDKTTGQSIAGAVVNWTFSKYAMTGSTDEKGHLDFRLPIVDRTTGESLRVVFCSGAGFNVLHAYFHCQEPVTGLDLQPEAREHQKKNRRFEPTAQVFDSVIEC
jgi:hypothetical protein